MSLLLPDEHEQPEENLAQVEDRQLEDNTISLAREFEMMRARLVRHVDEIDRRRTFEAAGYVSTTSWLRDACRFTAGFARSLVSTARSLRSMKRTRDAFNSGDLTFPAVQMLSIAAGDHPEHFERDESLLVGQAKELTPGNLRTTLDYWKQAADSDSGVAAAERQYRRRKLFVSKTLDGMVRLDGDLDPVGGAVVLAAVRSLADPDQIDANDDRSAPQRRADALVDVCQAHLDSGNSPISGGEKPHLSVIVDLQTLEGGASGSISELEDGTVIDPETARRLACDASISRVVVNGRSEPLDVGRRTRTIPAGLRRALAIRDKNCTFDGCDRPPQWCEAHHIVPWAQGGSTSLENLRLLCRRHHRLMHPDPDGPDP